MLPAPLELVPFLQQSVDWLRDVGVMHNPHVVERASSQEPPDFRNRLAVLLHRGDGFYLGRRWFPAIRPAQVSDDHDFRLSESRFLPGEGEPRTIKLL